MVGSGDSLMLGGDTVAELAELCGINRNSRNRRNLLEHVGSTPELVGSVRSGAEFVGVPRNPWSWSEPRERAGPRRSPPELYGIKLN